MTAPPLGPAEVARLLPATIAQLRAEVTAASDRVLAWHPGPGEWCVKDVLGHLIERDLVVPGTVAINE